MKRRYHVCVRPTKVEESDHRHACLLRARRERPSGYTAAEKCDEVPPPHGAYAKAKDHGSSIAGLGVASVACIATKSEKRRFGLPLRPSRSRKATFCDLNHRCRRDAGLFSSWTGMGRMLSRFWHWLEYDPVALAVLLIGVGSIALLVLGI